MSADVDLHLHDVLAEEVKPSPPSKCRRVLSKLSDGEKITLKKTINNNLINNNTEPRPNESIKSYARRMMNRNPILESRTVTASEVHRYNKNA